METYEQIIAEITDKIKTNGNKEITGAILQGVLLGIIAAVQANQQGKLKYYSEDELVQEAIITGEGLRVMNGFIFAEGDIGTRGTLTVIGEGGNQIHGETTFYDSINAIEGITLSDRHGHEYIITVDAQGNLVSTPKNS